VRMSTAGVASQIASADMFIRERASIRPASDGTSIYKVTVWNADQLAVAPEGEMFFELMGNNTYTLRPLQSA